ncbi:MAG: hypothetical protein P8N09_01895 [Planctomycetota bacterium]|jgi:hypothetical protein|nr:hypothetical protein [Planctomycetota bacterium]
MSHNALLRALFVTLFLGLFVSALPAQLCSSPSGTFWKNDGLPDNPGGTPITFSVIPGVCEGEAIGSYFQMSPGTGTQAIEQVSVGFGHAAGGAGFEATLNVEIYEGSVSFHGNGTATVGTKIFDLGADFGQSMQVFSTSINTFDMTPYGVEVSDDFVVVFRMNINLSFPGCPSSGAQANFFTDNGLGGSQCSPGVNLLDAQGTGWVDPAVWGPFPPFVVLCPSFYAGNWVIRACTSDVGGVGTWEDLGGGTVGSNGAPTLVGSGSLIAGQPATLLLTQAPPSGLVLAWFGLQSNPASFFGGAIYPLPPLNQLFFFSNFLGSLQLQTPWPSGIPAATEIWFQFLLDDPSVIYGITLSNAVKATTP